MGNSVPWHLSGHSNIHVANATKEKIFARVAEDKILVQEVDAGGKVDVGAEGVNEGTEAHADVKYLIDKLLHDGFVAIGPHDYLAFPTSNEPYVSVITQSGGRPCHNYRPGNDKSVIVTADLTIKQTKYGHIWMDVDGKQH